MMTLAEALQALADLRGEIEERAAIRRRLERAAARGLPLLAELPGPGDYLADAAARMREAEDLIQEALDMHAE